MNSGWVPGPRRVVVSGAGRGKLRLPAMFAVIRHPERGVILYDTGYSTGFYDATASFPYRIMRYFTPVEITGECNADRQLERAGIAPHEVKYIILGHGHADHVPGAAFFPGARIILNRKEWEAMQGPAWKLFTSAYLKSLYQDLPNQIQLLDFEQADKRVEPFGKALDLWGDGSMTLVRLPGHTPGQMGLMVKSSAGKELFFIGDAGWVRENWLELKPPSRIVSLIWSDWREFVGTLEKVREFHQKNPEVLIVPTHCPQAWEDVKTSGLSA